jgi:hypothetical protein
MNSLHDDVARALIDARLVSAQQRRLARQANGVRREARRTGWLLSRRPVDTPSMPSRGDLEGILDGTAERIVESGTRADTAILCAMSAATRRLSPGAAAALVDWDGSEQSRLRAFGIVHGVVLRGLSDRERSRLLGRLTRTAQREARALAVVEPGRLDSSAGDSEAA